MSGNASDDVQCTMRSTLQRIATGPGLSKGISVEEAPAGMNAVLSDQVGPVTRVRLDKPFVAVAESGEITTGHLRKAFEAGTSDQ